MHVKPAALGAKMSKALQAASGNGLSSLSDEANIFKAMANRRLEA